jgi:hypothetical protein
MWTLLLLFAALVGALASRRRHSNKLPAKAAIVSPRRSTVTAADGAVRSVQSAELTLPRAELDRLWAAPNLENLARTYWRFLSRVTLGFIRVRYGQDERAVVLLTRPFTLLRFAAPEYVMESGHGRVSWRIRDGLLVARTGRGSGYLALDVRRLDDDVGEGLAKVRIEAEVENFYPSIAVGFGIPVYEATQSAIHVLVTHSFLRSLAKLRLARSKVGRLRWLRAAAGRVSDQNGRGSEAEQPAARSSQP